MFKRYADFASVPAHDHPGQPVHCDRDFDVWQAADGKFFVIAGDGARTEYPTVDAAVSTTTAVIAGTPVPLTPAQVVANDEAAVAKATADLNAARTVEQASKTPA